MDTNLFVEKQVFIFGKRFNILRNIYLGHFVVLHVDSPSPMCKAL
jgi:hypothetical protein